MFFQTFCRRQAIWGLDHRFIRRNLKKKNTININDQTLEILLYTEKNLKKQKKKERKKLTAIEFCEIQECFPIILVPHITFASEEWDTISTKDLNYEQNG